jgi:hypothetical protein
MQPYGLFSSSPSCAWERVIARQAVLGIGKVPSSAWVAIGFPSATWEPEDNGIICREKLERRPINMPYLEQRKKYFGEMPHM